MEIGVVRPRSGDMMFSRRQLFPVLLGGARFAKVAASELRPITLRASDGVSVYAWHEPAADKTLPAILLFHQAGSNHAEYAPIAPRLAATRYHSLALDQRSGGSMWSQSNRTASELGKEVDYRAVLPDLEAALEWPHHRGSLDDLSSGEAAIPRRWSSSWRRSTCQPWRR